MPGGRDITGADVRAVALVAGPGREVAMVIAARIGRHEVFAGYEELARRHPPDTLGISSGVHAALFAPLFGEFE